MEQGRAVIADRFKLLPNFPQNRTIHLEDKALFDTFFNKSEPEISEFTFSNLFCWRDAYAMQISRLEEFLIISSHPNSNLSFFEPLGNGDKARAINFCLKQYPKSRVFRLPASTAALFDAKNDFKLIEDRDNFDYLYRREDLADLKGRAYDAKRNFLKRFQASYQPLSRQLEPADIEQCLRFQEEWCDNRSCASDAGLERERMAIKEMFNNFQRLNLSGVIIEIKGKLEAFALGERLNNGTFVIHAEKANGKFLGIYQAINQLFASFIPKGFSFINREQDLGIANLRKAKLSYHPYKLIKKFIISKAR